MPTLDVVDLERRKVGAIEVVGEIFGSSPETHTVHAAVVMQQACERQGTASTLRRGEVSGSGKKPWKQKHTGRARAGSIRSPIWRHGGSVFGPKPRDYGYSIPRKLYRSAMHSALSARCQDGSMVVLSDLSLPQPKTKLLAKALTQLGLSKRILIVLDDVREEIERAARNLPDVKVMTVERLNVYDLLRHDSIVVMQAALPKIQEMWS